MAIASHLRAAVTVLVLFGLPMQPALSVQDHNSSRSNKTASAAAPSEVETLLDQTRADASTVAKAMFGIFLFLALLLFLLVYLGVQLFT